MFSILYILCIISLFVGGTVMPYFNKSFQVLAFFLSALACMPILHCTCFFTVYVLIPPPLCLSKGSRAKSSSLIVFLCLLHPSHSYSSQLQSYSIPVQYHIAVAHLPSSLVPTTLLPTLLCSFSLRPVPSLICPNPSFTHPAPQPLTKLPAPCTPMSHS